MKRGGNDNFFVDSNIVIEVLNIIIVCVIYYPGRIYVSQKLLKAL